MGTTITPLATYVVATQEDAVTKTASGLLLPDNAQEKPKVANIVAVGKDVEQLKVGDKVIYKGYSTTEFKVDADAYILLKEEDVLATVK